MKAIPLVFPLCMAHQFNLRIYAQSTMLMMWTICEEKGLSKVLETYQIMEAIKTFHDISGYVDHLKYMYLQSFLSRKLHVKYSWYFDDVCFASICLAS
jgi:hypothetical protein